MKLRFALIEFEDEAPEDMPGATVLWRSTHDPRPAEQRMTHLAGMLMDLDRCEHGRHEGDACNQCGGPSVGNRVPQDDRILGFDISGRAIFIPDRGEDWEYARPPETSNDSNETDGGDG